ncbi:MAG: hypothetical protein AAGF75_04155, partial [Cyanobacteria bacterium P01_H01_bin.130]
PLSRRWGLSPSLTTVTEPEVGWATSRKLPARFFAAAFNAVAALVAWDASMDALSRAIARCPNPPTRRAEAIPRAAMLRMLRVVPLRRAEETEELELEFIVCEEGVENLWILDPVVNPVDLDDQWTWMTSGLK